MQLLFLLFLLIIIASLSLYLPPFCAYSLI